MNSIFENRRAVRKFKTDAVSDEDIKKIVAAFQTSPCIKLM